MLKSVLLLLRLLWVLCRAGRPGNKRPGDKTPFSELEILAPVSLTQRQTLSREMLPWPTPAAVGCGLFCWAALCFLGSGSTDTGVTQTPKYLVAGVGRKRSLTCAQSLGHNTMYWYRQLPDKPPELMFVYNYKAMSVNETIPSRFSPECPNSSHLHLHVNGLQPIDSAVYLCASSEDTALQSHHLPQHKPKPSRKPEGAPGLVLPQGTTKGTLFLITRHLGQESSVLLRRDPAMYPRLLCCWVLLSLLETGHSESGVRQTPSHQVTRMEQTVILRCDPIPGHLYLYWYRQIPGQNLEFLISFFNDKLSEKSEMFKDRFSAERPESSFSTLKIQPAKPGDSAVYLCASSKDTALQSHLLAVHKPTQPPPLLQLPTPVPRREREV
ncbi:PREDICTED: uncharacterized protein LOC102841200 [Chrysochloris asiatica]|uniref:Uncharacterized protein LOC102841200 n=1 Tax=Chrysochloris asiatica TaxID=185453 RepID=A0A9B0TCK5_CHRAS|nr:PREDICTED: uncharacterized protein LOC102841200 [Chrysochloris asiatica]